MNHLCNIAFLFVKLWFVFDCVMFMWLKIRTRLFLCIALGAGEPGNKANMLYHCLLYNIGAHLEWGAGFLSASSQDGEDFHCSIQCLCKRLSLLCVQHYSHGEALVVEPLLHALEDTEESPLKDFSIMALATVTKVGMCRKGGNWGWWWVLR